MTIATRSSTALRTRVRRALAEGGVPLLASRVLRRASGGWLRVGRITIFERALDEPIAGPPAAAITVRRASGADLPRLLRQRDAAALEPLFRERLRRGDDCFIAIAPDGRVAHSRWVTRRSTPIPELGRELELEPGRVYMYDGYTTPERRGQGVDGLIRTAIFREAARAGGRAVYSYVRHDNPAGLRAARRWQTPVGTVAYFGLGRLRPLLFGAATLRGLRLVPTPLGRDDETARAARAAATRAWFERFAERPHAQRSTGCDTRPVAYFEDTGRFIADRLRLDPHQDTVLDVGCDSAMVTRHVAPRCRRLVGVDLIANMLRDIAGPIHSASGAPVTFAATDGRYLPFAAGTFSKVYCCAVIHMLPTRADGLALVREAVRVCRPGGCVLIASVPDRGRRGAAIRDAWRRSDARGRLRLLAALALPRGVRRALAAGLKLAPASTPEFLTYPLTGLARQLEAAWFACAIERFPADYWSTDFQITRANLLIRVPDARETAARGLAPGRSRPEGVPPVACGIDA